MSVNPVVLMNGSREMNREPDPEVVSMIKRRTFSTEYKLRILVETDACTEHGEIGALLRREGLYSSHLHKWRTQRERGILPQGQTAKRGRKPDPQAAEIVRLQKENDRLRARVERAEYIINVQKKLAHLLGTMPGETLLAEMS